MSTKIGKDLESGSEKGRDAARSVTISAIPAHTDAPDDDHTLSSGAALYQTCAWSGMTEDAALGWARVSMRAWHSLAVVYSCSAVLLALTWLTYLSPWTGISRAPWQIVIPWLSIVMWSILLIGHWRHGPQFLAVRKVYVPILGTFAACQVTLRVTMYVFSDQNHVPFRNMLVYTVCIICMFLTEHVTGFVLLPENRKCARPRNFMWGPLLASARQTIRLTDAYSDLYVARQLLREAAAGLCNQPDMLSCRMLRALGIAAFVFAGIDFACTVIMSFLGRKGKADKSMSYKRKVLALCFVIALAEVGLILIYVVRFTHVKNEALSDVLFIVYSCMTTVASLILDIFGAKKILFALMSRVAPGPWVSSRQPATETLARLNSEDAADSLTVTVVPALPQSSNAAVEGFTDPAGSDQASDAKSDL